MLINPQWVNENFDQGQKGRGAADRGEYRQPAGVIAEAAVGGAPPIVAPRHHLADASA